MVIEIIVFLTFVRRAFCGLERANVNLSWVIRIFYTRIWAQSRVHVCVQIHEVIHLRYVYFM